MFIYVGKSAWAKAKRFAYKAHTYKVERLFKQFKLLRNTSVPYHLYAISSLYDQFNLYISLITIYLSSNNYK